MSRPWDRQHNETSSYYQYFQSYLEFGSGVRSVRLVCELYGKSSRYLEMVSSKHGWVARARAWDVHCAEIQRLETEKRIRQQAAQEARRLDLLGSEITGSHLAIFRQAKRRLNRLRQKERDAIAKSDDRLLPTEEQWKSIESSMAKMLRIAEAAENRLRNKLLGTQEQDSQSQPADQPVIAPHVAAAALAGVSQASGAVGPDSGAAE